MKKEGNDEGRRLCEKACFEVGKQGRVCMCVCVCVCVRARERRNILRFFNRFNTCTHCRHPLPPFTMPMDATLTEAFGALARTFL